MNEHIVVEDRHLVAPLSDEELTALRVLAARSNLSIKEVVRQAIVEKLNKEGN